VKNQGDRKERQKGAGKTELAKCLERFKVIHLTLKSFRISEHRSGQFVLNAESTAAIPSAVVVMTTGQKEAMLV
jgi:hypothetical protein